MKKKWIAALVTVCALLMCVGCKNSADDDPAPIVVESVTLSETELSLEPGETVMLTATVKPENAEDKSVKWSSSDTSVAMVDNDGTVGAIKTGTAIITAQAGGKTAICVVTVNEVTMKPNPVAVESVTLDVPTLTLTIKETVKLTATVNPKNADDKTVIWLSSDRAVATVSEDGTVTAVKKGEATITAWVGGKEARCEVFVSVPTMEDFGIDDYGVLGAYFGNDATIVIPDGVTGIDDGVFSYNMKLTDVTIPASVTNIGEAFNDSYNLKSVTYTGTLAQWCAVDGLENLLWRSEYMSSSSLYSGIVTLTLDGISNLKSETAITIPEGVKSIGDYAFYKCTGLKTVSIGDGVESIGTNAFYMCESLESVMIPDSVRSIGWNAFCWCRSLKSVTIPKGVTSIEDSAFSFCDSLTSVTIPDGVTIIGKDAFSVCESLESVSIPDSVTEIGEDAFDNCTKLTNVVIPSNVTEIGERAFRLCQSLTSVTIPDGVTVIENRAFDGCHKLTSVNIPDKVTKIGNEAFHSCKLETVIIPSSVIEIGDNAFDNCQELTSVTIPASVTYIGSKAFDGCYKLKTVSYGGTKDEWEKIEGIGDSGLSGKTILYNQ